ncbi:MAG: aldehyde dehydrogenase family protein [Pseudobdellovibrionaceae bacterium]
MDFVQSLQDLKKARDQWAQKDISERSMALIQIADAMAKNKNLILKTSFEIQKMPQNFLALEEIDASVQVFQSVAQQKPPEGFLPRPSGLVSILLPEFFSVRILAERLAPALLAGNGIFVFFPKSVSSLLSVWQKILPSDLPVRLFTGDAELEQVMTAHPSIQAVSFYGLPERAAKLPLAALSGSWKKWQVSGGFHNAALILNDVDLSQVATQLAESCFVGMGQLPWNISTIYVTENLRPDFEKLFLSAVEALPAQTVSEATFQKNEKLLEQFQNEKGKILFGGQAGQPTLVEDHSHCSVLQQDCLSAPIVLISPVKYAHEMVKWANTSYYGMYAQIFGSAEKVGKFASQLDVSRVGANSWISSMQTLPQGLKQSFFGIPDLHSFAGFFSDMRKIDGSESKS